MKAEGISEQERKREREKVAKAQRQKGYRIRDDEDMKVLGERLIVVTFRF